MIDERDRRTNNTRTNSSITEQRARLLNQLNPNLIQSNGRYPGYVNGIPIGVLSYDEIMYLRKKYSDPTIAPGYEFNGVRPLEAKNLEAIKQISVPQYTRQPRNPNDIQRRDAAVQKPASTNRNVPNTMQRSQKRRPKRRKYALQRTRKFVGYIIRTIEKDGKKIMFKVGGVALAAVICASLYNIIDGAKDPIIIEPDTSIVVEDSNVAGTFDEEVKTEEELLMEWRQETIAKYAYEYNLDYNTVWYFMQGITSNFQDPGYLYEYTLENVSCKGSGQLYCDSEEELISYTIRVLKQEPGRFNLTEEQLKRKTNDYIRPTSESDYKQIVFEKCMIHGGDPALIYAIFKQETGFSSENFMLYNNPGGIFFNGKIAKFDTVEEGILELIHEVDKYQRMGATTIEEIRDIHCPLGDKNDKYGLNYHWVPNVREIYNEMKPEFERMEAEYQAQQELESTGIRH